MSTKPREQPDVYLLVKSDFHPRRFRTPAERLLARRVHRKRRGHHLQGGAQAAERQAVDLRPVRLSRPSRVLPHSR